MQTRVKMFLTPLLSGLVLGLSFLNHFEFLVFIGLVPLFFFWLSRAQSLRDYFWGGFLAQFVFIAISFFWIQAAGKTYFLLSPAASFLFYMAFTALLSLQWALVGMVFGYFRQFGLKGLEFCLPFFMIFLDELVFQFIPIHFGFHWYAGSFPGLGWASWIGLTGLGFIALVINLILTFFIQKKNLKFSAAAFGVLAVFLWSTPKASISGDLIHVLGVQGNISNEVKRTDLQVMQNKMMSVDKYYSLTRQGLKSFPETSFDLIVWPETTLPFVWKQKAENAHLDPLQDDVLAFANRIQKPILSGSYYDDGGTYNAVISMTPAQSFEHSEKKFLFPIGEVIPFHDFGGLTKNMFPEVPRFKAEKQPVLLSLQNHRLAVPICYESLFSDYFEAFAEPIEGIISLSNDAWFESALQKRWHALIALSRSVEYGVPVLRVTNNGDSGSADARGDYQFVENSKELTFKTEMALPSKSEMSFMQKNGELVRRVPRLISYFLIFYFLIMVRRRRSRP